MSNKSCGDNLASEKKKGGWKGRRKKKKKNTAVIVESGAELIEPQNLESAIKGFQMTQCVFFFLPRFASCEINSR